jgi:hypothetical protein
VQRNHVPCKEGDIEPLHVEQPSGLPLSLFLSGRGRDAK